MGNNVLLKGSQSLIDPFKCAQYNAEFRKAHPTYFDPEGLMIFCGPQGSGKTLSAVQYCKKVLELYPKCIFVTNVEIKGISDQIQVVEYDGLRSLMEISNGFEGVLYLIDEIHLEFNSLESKNISIEEMTEIAQQRKQRKHIVGTSQVYMRLAKPFREQIHDVILCRKYFNCLQYNVHIDGVTSSEEDGKLHADVKGKYLWFHTPELYGSYDTYAKMKRYKKEWQGRGVNAGYARPQIYDPNGGVTVGHGRKR